VPNETGGTAKNMIKTGNYSQRQAHQDRAAVVQSTCHKGIGRGRLQLCWTKSEKQPADSSTSASLYNASSRKLLRGTPNSSVAKKNNLQVREDTARMKGAIKSQLHKE